MVLTKCDQCRGTYAERNPPEEPPCEICYVELWSENEEAIRIFTVVRNQFIMGPTSAIDINHLAIYGAMDLYKVKNRRQCFEKVLRLANWWLEQLRKKEQ